MERTEQMYTIQKQMDFGKIKVRLRSSCTETLNKEQTDDFPSTLMNKSDPVQKCLQSRLSTLFPLQPFPLISSSRWLKKRGELTISAEELSIWRAFSNKSYYLFLFNDVLIVTRKKR